MTEQPKRIQLRRTKGWRKPEGAIVVARPSRWGNPFRYRTPHGLVRYRPEAPDGWEYEGRISADGMRHDYFHPDGSVTRYNVRYATRAETVELFRRTLLEPDRGMLGAYPSNGGHLATFRTGQPFPDHLGTVTVQMIKEALGGHDLACWCPVGTPCHADVLLELANKPGGPQ
ncbi:MAG: hypothetical protein JWO46_740 [Nocardioidaceae bacterium]|nr:hypothetical protein [Nocardioidaceae bacterium]